MPIYFTSILCFHGAVITKCIYIEQRRASGNTPHLLCIVFPTPGKNLCIRFRGQATAPRDHAGIPSYLDNHQSIIPSDRDASALSGSCSSSHRDASAWQDFQGSKAVLHCYYTAAVPNRQILQGQRKGFLLRR